MKVPTEAVNKFLSSAGNILGKNLIQWTFISFDKGTLTVSLTTANGQSILKVPAEGKDSFEVGVPYNVLLQLCKSKNTEISVKGNVLSFKKNKTHTGTVNVGDYEKVKIKVPDEKESSKLLSAIPYTALSISYSGATLVAQVRSEGKNSTILTGDGFHFAIYKSRKLGNFNIPTSYVSYCKSLFTGQANLGCIDNFFVAWDDTTTLRLPMIDPESNVPFAQATDAKLLENAKTSFVCESSDLSEKLENVMLAYNVQEDRVILTPSKEGITLAISSTVGKNAEFLSAKVKTNGKGIILDPANLSDILRLVEGKVTVEFIERDGINKIFVVKNDEQTLYMVASTQ